MQEPRGWRLHKDCGTAYETARPVCSLTTGRADPVLSGRRPWTSRHDVHPRGFLTRRLWSVREQAAVFHDGRFTILRAAVLAHSGEAPEQDGGLEGLAPNVRRP